METFDNLEPKTVALEVTENSKTYLKTAASWSKFMAILAFIGVGFLALCALMMIPMGAFMDNYTSLPFSFSIIGLFYLAIAVVMLFPALYLLRFSKKTAEALANQNSLEMEDAFKNMKSYWKFIGIFTIVMLALSILVVPFVVLASIASTGMAY